MQEIVTRLSKQVRINVGRVDFVIVTKENGNVVEVDIRSEIGTTKGTPEVTGVLGLTIIERSFVEDVERRGQDEIRKVVGEAKERRSEEVFVVEVVDASLSIVVGRIDERIGRQAVERTTFVGTTFLAKTSIPTFVVNIAEGFGTLVG